MSFGLPRFLGWGSGTSSSVGVCGGLVVVVAALLLITGQLFSGLHVLYALYISLVVSLNTVHVLQDPL